MRHLIPQCSVLHHNKVINSLNLIAKKKKKEEKPSVGLEEYLHEMLTKHIVRITIIIIIIIYYSLMYEHKYLLINLHSYTKQICVLWYFCFQFFFSLSVWNSNRDVEPLFRGSLNFKSFCYGKSYIFYIGTTYMFYLSPCDLFYFSTFNYLNTC